MRNNIYHELTCEYKYHREDFETCPHCGKKQSTKTWDKKAVDLILGEVGGVSDKMAVVSECPECFEKSWVHESCTAIVYSEYHSSWKKAADREMKKRSLWALREWGRSICWQCKKLKEGTVDTKAWRHCEKGSGPAETKCNAYKGMQSLLRKKEQK